MPHKYARIAIITALCAFSLLDALPAADQSKILYLHGNVDKNGNIPPVGSLYQQMLTTNTAEHGMSKFRLAVEEEGFSVQDQVDTVELTTTLLNSYQVLILSSNQKIFSSAEQQVVAQWVQNGGGIIAFSDANFGGSNQAEPREVIAPRGRDSDNSLIEQFGMFILLDQGTRGTISNYNFSHYLNGFKSSGGFTFEGEGVSPILVSSPAVVVAKYTTEPNTTLPGERTDLDLVNQYYLGNIATLAIAEIGQGRVIATYDRNTFWNENDPPSPDYPATRTNIEEHNNKEFAKRLVNWAAKAEIVSDNTPPVVSAGNDQVVTAQTLSVSLSGSMSDNYAPGGPGGPGLQCWWTQVSGPAGLSFANQGSTVTTANFPLQNGNARTGTYILRLTANDGSLSTIDDVQITVGGPQTNLPTVTLQTDSLSYAAPATVMLTASASDSNGSVTKVEFFANGQLLFSDTNSPWDFNWSNVPIGNYTLTAKAYDNAGNVSLSSGATVSIIVGNVQNNLPTVTLSTDSLSYLAPANVLLNASATDSDGTISKVEFFADGNLLSSDTTAPYTFSWPNVPVGNYSLTAMAYDNAGGVATSAPTAITVSANTGLPAPWVSGDVGSTTPAGSASLSSGVFTVLGAGADIWGTADGFHFVSQPISGDCTITARVISVQNTDAWAKAGVMIRESRSAGSKHASMFMTPANGAAFQRRSSTDSTSQITKNTGYTAPYWVRLQRTGNTITGYRSADGSSWTSVGSATVTMNTAVEVGLAVTSHANGTLCTATFDNVNVSASNPPTNVAPTVSAGADLSIVLPNTAALNGTVTDDDLPTPVNLTQTWSAVSGPGTVSFANASAVDTTASFSSAGTYVLSLTASDGALSASDTVTVTVNPPANVLPTVSLATNGSSFTAPANISLTSSANDSDGSISNVEFFADGNLLFSDTTAPYAFDWANVPVGNYSLTAKAYDNLGGVTTSTPAAITVSAPTTTIFTAINSGGAATGGFVADVGFSGGSKAYSTTATIDMTHVANPAPEMVYKSERYISTGNLIYTISGLPVSQGQLVTVRLHFAEIFSGATNTNRIFHVEIDGTRVIENFNIFSESQALYGSGVYKALTKEFTLSPASSTMTIQFIKNIGNPKVNGIEILVSANPNG